jgi:hypothetical protein
MPEAVSRRSQPAGSCAANAPTIGRAAEAPPASSLSKPRADRHHLQPPTGEPPLAARRNPRSREPNSASDRDRQSEPQPHRRPREANRMPEAASRRSQPAPCSPRSPRHRPGLQGRCPAAGPLSDAPAREPARATETRNRCCQPGPHHPGRGFPPSSRVGPPRQYSSAAADPAARAPKRMTGERDRLQSQSATARRELKTQPPGSRSRSVRSGANPPPERDERRDDWRL